MASYKVTIRETEVYAVEVNASDENHAIIEAVEDMWYWRTDGEKTLEFKVEESGE